MTQPSTQEPPFSRQEAAPDALLLLPRNMRHKKSVADVKELYFANKGLGAVPEMAQFESLEVLWLNSNKLENVDGLDGNFRLTELYLQHNRITTLEGSVEYLTNLEVLNLAANRVANLDKTLECLRDCRRLRALDLYGNPVAEEDNYRIRVIAQLPSVEVLDRHRVTTEEREKAKLLRSRKHQKRSTAQQKQQKQQKSVQAIENVTMTTEHSRDNAVTLANAFAKLRGRLQEKRINLEPEWRVHDPRRLGGVPHREMLRVLQLYSLDVLLNAQEMEALQETYLKEFRIPTSFYEPHPRTQQLFNYVEFCRELNRAQNELFSTPGSTDQHLSASVKDLKAFVTRVHHREARKASTLPPRAMTAGPPIQDNATMFRRRFQGEQDVDRRPWEVMESKKLLDTVCAGPKTTAVTEAQLIDFAQRMAEAGRKLDMAGLRQRFGERMTKEHIVDALHDPGAWQPVTPQEATATTDMLFQRAQATLQRLHRLPTTKSEGTHQQQQYQKLRESIAFAYRHYTMAAQSNTISNRDHAAMTVQFKSSLRARSTADPARRSVQRGDYFVLSRPATTGSSNTVTASSQVFRVC